MKKDLILRTIQISKFIWREAKKPVIRIKKVGKIALLPWKGSAESGQPKLSYRISLDLTLVYVLLGALAVHSICRRLWSWLR